MTLWKELTQNWYDLLSSVEDIDANLQEYSIIWKIYQRNENDFLELPAFMMQFFTGKLELVDIVVAIFDEPSVERFLNDFI